MAEKEYIEREAAIDEIESLSVTVTGLRAGKNLLTRYAKHYKDSVVKVLSDVPAADVVEVVRCKNCKNAYINSFSAQSGIAVCRFLANRSNGELTIVQQDDFCSYGERKEATP